MAPKKEENRVIKGAIRPWYRWHRRIGVTSAIFVIVLSVTGLILNHNVTLNLHKNYVTSEWLLNWYGYDADADYANEILTVDKVILDIHTGRFFGPLGPYVMDAAAIAFLVLAGTGIYMWYRRKPAKKGKKK